MQGEGSAVKNRGCCRGSETACGIRLSGSGTDRDPSEFLWKRRPEEQENLLTLIQAVHEVDGIERIRLGSLEPGIITKEFAKAISSLPKCVRISSVTAKRMYCYTEANESTVHSAGVPGKM